MPRMKLIALCFTCCVFWCGTGPAFAAEPADALDLWPGVAPGDPKSHSEEHNTTKPSDGLVARRPVIRLGNVFHPTISIYSPPEDRQNGTAVLVCPGGGYSILAMDLEGTEVCDWLNSIGITGVLLKYRVPARPGRQRYTAPLQDAERAMGLVRLHAHEWGVASNHIGVLGFSAGGHLAALLSNSGDRTYPPLDAADTLSCRPNFTLLVYPAYLKGKGPEHPLAPELHLSSETPPTFLVMAEDDPVGVENVLDYALGLRALKVPFELHVYPTGGHGYGLRRTKDLVTTWPQRAADWMRSRGWLEKSH